MRIIAVALMLVALAVAPAQAAATAVPRFDHVVVLVEENHAESQVIGSPDAPYLTALARSNAELTQSYAITHPSQPNYLALFSGSTQGLTDDTCPHTYSTDNLATSLAAGGQSFTGYSEDLPGVGYTGCGSGAYARKHNPWSDFPAVPASANQPFSAFPTEYSTLPSVSFVIPNLTHDMHDGTVAQADSWVQQNLSGYIDWATTHNSLFVLTFDEDDHSDGNRVATILAGANLVLGAYSESVNHYNLLSTIAQAFGISAPGEAATAAPITDIWTSALVSDAFNRTVGGGWGSADVGGSYSLTGPPTNFSVAPNAGAINVAKAGQSCGAFLLSATTTSTDLLATFTLGKRPAGGPAYVYLVGRRVSSGNGYQARVLFARDGTVRLQLVRGVAGKITALTAKALISGLQYVAGTALSVRTQVSGTSPTVVRARAWTVNEPDTWTVSATDASAALQHPGALGVIAGLDTRSTSAPLVVSVRSLSAS